MTAPFPPPYSIGLGDFAIASTIVLLTRLKTRSFLGMTKDVAIAMPPIPEDAILYRSANIIEIRGEFFSSEEGSAIFQQYLQELNSLLTRNRVAIASLDVPLNPDIDVLMHAPEKEEGHRMFMFNYYDDEATGFERCVADAIELLDQPASDTKKVLAYSETKYRPEGVDGAGQPLFGNRTELTRSTVRIEYTDLDGDSGDLFSAALPRREFVESFVSLTRRILELQTAINRIVATRKR